MPRRTARGNRIGLAIIGLILLLAGATGLARGLDLYPGLLGAAHAPITGRATRAFADGHTWFWIAVAAVAAVIGLAALRWLAVQARTEAQRTIRLESDPRQGITTVHARAVTSAFENDLLDSPDVRHAAATLTGTPAHPRLSLTVTLEPNTDPATAKDRTHQALQRLRQALQTPHLPAIVYIRTSR
ncbi:MAG: alkaline shock response membrane anchor protein AmaP [Actinoallomurus sp.]